MKARIDDLAAFGGRPLFESPRPIGQLSVPGVEEYLGLIAESLDCRHLSNDGPLVRRLEGRLAAHHGEPHCIALANAGLGLMMLMQSLAGGRRGEVIMPAFSYRGLPHFARWAGHRPRFCDVDPHTHFLDLRSVEEAIGPETTMILGVCNAHHRGDAAGLCELARRHGLPVVLDAVYAIHAAAGVGLGAPEAAAEVYSLHATKLLAGFEGGYVVTRSRAVADRLAWQRNFTLPAFRPDHGGADLDHVLGLNAKLNEFHAGMALASLAALPATIEANRRRYAAYAAGLQGIAGLDILPYANPKTANFQLVILAVQPPWPLSRDQTVALLRAEGMAIGGYYAPPLYRGWEPPAFELPITEDLARRFLQLPVGEFVDAADIAAICGCLRFIADHGAGIGPRLAGGGAA